MRDIREEAARYLEHRMRTVMEMRDHLSQKGYEAEDIEAVIEEFEQLHYLDDAQYAMSYCDYAYGKKRGRRRIIRELVERGVDQETGENAIDDYIYENEIDEVENGLAIALQSVDLDSDVFEDRDAARISRKLEQRGYSTGDIIRVLGRIREMISGD